jgi:hypothetical protein
LIHSLGPLWDKIIEDRDLRVRRVRSEGILA